MGNLAGHYTGGLSTNWLPLACDRTYNGGCRVAEAGATTGAVIQLSLGPSQ